MRDQRSSNGENITTRSDRIAHLAMFRLPCSHDKRRDNFDFPHYAWTKVRGKVTRMGSKEPICSEMEKRPGRILAGLFICAERLLPTALRCAQRVPPGG